MLIQLLAVVKSKSSPFTSRTGTDIIPSDDMVKEYVNQFKDLVDYFIIVSQDGEELNIPSEDIEFEDELLNLEVQYGRQFFNEYYVIYLA